MGKCDGKKNMTERLEAARSLFGILPKDADFDEARYERLSDLESYEKAMKAFRENPVTYTLEEVEKELFEENSEGEVT